MIAKLMLAAIAVAAGFALAVWQQPLSPGVAPTPGQLSSGQAGSWKPWKSAGSTTMTHEGQRNQTAIRSNRSASVDALAEPATDSVLDAGTEAAKPESVTAAPSDSGATARASRIEDVDQFAGDVFLGLEKDPDLTDTTGLLGYVDLGPELSPDD